MLQPHVHTRIKISASDTIETLVDGQWWDVVEYKEVPSGIRCFFKDDTTMVIPHEEVHKRIKVKPPTRETKIVI